MKPEEYKIGTNIIYRLFCKVGSLEGQILGYSDSKKYVNIESKNGSSNWYEIDDIGVVDTVERIKSDNSEYIVDSANNEFFSNKKQCEEDIQNILFTTDDANILFKTEDADDPRMTEEDWEDLANQLYSNKNTYECYPENYLQTDCRYFLEIYNNTDWKLCLRNNLSVPKFDLSGELHPYTLGEGKIEKREMNSMYTFVNLKRIVDGLNLIAKPNENLNPYPKMSVETLPYPEAITDALFRKV